MTAHKRTALIAANAAALAIAAAFFYWSFSVQPLYPSDGAQTDYRTPTFGWAGHAAAYELLIDDDPAFGTPLSFSVSGNSYEAPEMDFGTYWWKVRNSAGDTPPRSITIVSNVALSRPVKSIITNTGNTQISVEGDMITGAVTMAVNESIEIGEDENVRAEQQ